LGAYLAAACLRPSYCQHWDHEVLQAVGIVASIELPSTTIKVIQLYLLELMEYTPQLRVIAIS
jgi:hypothetical protein